MRLLKRVRIGHRCEVKIYRDPSAPEFIVHTIVNGKRDGGYFTGDKADARGTAAAQVRWAKKQPACRRTA